MLHISNKKIHGNVMQLGFTLIFEQWDQACTYPKVGTGLGHAVSLINLRPVPVMPNLVSKIALNG